MSLWEAFDDSDDESVAEVSACHQVATAILIQLRRERSISWQRVCLRVGPPHRIENWKKAFEARNMYLVTDTRHTCSYCDVMVWDGDLLNKSTLDLRLVPGGYLVCPSSTDASSIMTLFSVLGKELSLQSPPVELCPGWIFFERPASIPASETCPWLSSKQKTQLQERSGCLSVVPLSSMERERHCIKEAAIRSRIVDNIRAHGYCVVPGLLCQDSCQSFGRAVLNDMHAAADVLKQRSGANLYQPTSNDGTYREISLREDWRLDLRDGPLLREARNEMPNFLRHHPDVIAICEELMFPSDPRLAAGNYGKYNFAGTQQERLSIGPVGGIVSLPGAADQAIHADTAHLFEVGDHLPPHYINVFAGAIPNATGVGPTAFIHGSHRREYVARVHVNDALLPAMWDDLVRPRLDVGDVVIFDCRILHFGLANTHPSIERPLLYTNITAHWFHDPKNWNDKESIFDSCVS